MYPTISNLFSWWVFSCSVSNRHRGFNLPILLQILCSILCENIYWDLVFNEQVYKNDYRWELFIFVLSGRSHQPMIRLQYQRIYLLPSKISCYAVWNQILRTGHQLRNCFSIRYSLAPCTWEGSLRSDVLILVSPASASWRHNISVTPASIILVTNKIEIQCVES